MRAPHLCFRSSQAPFPAGDEYRAEILRSPGGEASHEIRACFRTSLERVYGQRNTGLRLKLHLERAPELADLPWELLLDGSSDRFLSLSVETPVVRYLELAQRIPPLPIELPLEILVMVSSPRDHAPLNVQRERALRRQDFHIFHFIGHGGFDRATDEGVLVLEDDEGRGQTVDGHRLATVLQNRRSLRLAVLNACEGARISRADPYAGVATTLSAAPEKLPPSYRATGLLVAVRLAASAATTRRN